MTDDEVFDEAFEGRWIRLPMPIVTRIANEARAVLARETRWVDEDASRVDVIMEWLNSRPPRIFAGAEARQNDDIADAQGVQEAGYRSETSTMPTPWEPDERQQQLLDSVDRRRQELHELIEATEKMSGAPGLTEEYLAHLHGREAELSLVYVNLWWLLRRVYGPQGVG